MLKTFYKIRPTRKVFFTNNIKIRSFAYGDDVLEEFLDWRSRFLLLWNKPKDNFLILESGDIGSNYAKVDISTDVHVSQLSDNQQSIVRKSRGLTPLWFSGLYLDISREGELLVNGEISSTWLGSELKAWGTHVRWVANEPTFTLFAVGKDKKGKVELRGYPVDKKLGPIDRVVVSMPLPATLSAKSHLYIFGNHIFLIHENQLYYYYYNIASGKLEEVAIQSDAPNADKLLCQNVEAPIVCDSNGSVYWRSGNNVYGFPIGSPAKVVCIEGGERNDLVSLQCFKDGLFIYRKNKITKEYSCLQYKLDRLGNIEGKIFNNGAQRNLFFAERNGFLHYLKIPSAARRGFVCKNTGGVESVVKDVELRGAEKMFYINGNLYLDFDYVGTRIV